MSLGAFAIIQLITEKTGSTEISQFAGLYRKAPLLAVAFGILILSLAGFPGTAGFIGKLNIFMGAFVDKDAHYVLGSVMIATTVVSYFYYFGIMTQMFFRPAADDSKVKIPYGIQLVLIVCIAASVLLGVAPNIGLDFVHEHFNQFQDFMQ